MAAMDLDASHPDFNWAHNAFVTLNENDMLSSSEKWPAFGSTSNNHHSHLSSPTFTVPPSLLTDAAVERYGQITPPDELSPAEPTRDSAREGSIPVEQLQNEALWPEDQLPSLQDYPTQQPPDSHEHSQAPDRDVDAGEASPKRRRSGRHTAATVASQSSPADHPVPPQQGTAASNPQPPKRKRGRPKSQPQMVEAYTSDGYPFQVSSARQSHLEKNRVAAHKCRQRKKEYISGLESRARDYSAKNKALKENVAMLREEVLQLKNEVLRHAGCDFWAVDEYLARCAGDLLGMPAPAASPSSRTHTQTQSPTLNTLERGSTGRAPSAESASSQITIDSLDQDDYGGLELLKDFDDDMEDEVS